MLRPATIAWGLGLIVLAAFGFIYFGSAGPQRGVGPGSLVGRPAQSFRTQSLSGAPASLQSFRGKIVVLNLWASWCPPCRAEMPDLHRLYRTYKSRNVVVLGVNQGESAQRAGAFARSLQIDFPILLDQSQQYGRVYAALGLPSTFIIDRAGTVASGFDGALTFDQMTAAVRPLLGKN